MLPRESAMSGFHRRWGGVLMLRGFAMAVSLSCLIAAGPAAAQTLRVGNSSAPAFNFLPLTIAAQQKIFAANGIEVEAVNLEGSAKLHQAMTAGAIDMGLGAGTDIAFLVKGAPEKAVGALALTPALFGVVLPQNSPIKSLADLKGKRIGISTVGSLTQWLVLQLGKKQGWGKGDFIFVTDGSSYAPQLAALETGQVDAQITGAAMGWNLEEQKKGSLLAPASDFVGSFLMNVIFASDEIIKSNPDAVRRFLKSWYEAVDFMAAHKAETIAVAKALANFSDSVQSKQYDAVMPSMSRDGRFPPSAVAAVEESFVDLNILPAKPDMTNYLTEQYLPQRKQAKAEGNVP
jgi:NitT/TauT family transport system substrate-binding protein